MNLPWKRFDPTSSNSNILPRIPPDLFPTFPTRATLIPLPPPDGPQTVRSGREEGLPAPS